MAGCQTYLLGRGGGALYGPGYLPRKFKIAFTLPPENDVDVYAQDLSFVAIAKEGKLLGYDILAGGGMGYAYGNPGSFPRLADIIGFCFPEQVEEVARQVLLIHKEFSTRCNRKTSRLRYTIAGKGLGWFTNELATRLPFSLQAARPFSLSTNGDAADVPGRQTIEIEGGRIQNSNRQQLKTAFHEIASIHQGDFFTQAIRIWSLTASHRILPSKSNPSLGSTIFSPTIRGSGAIPPPVPACHFARRPLQTPKGCFQNWWMNWNRS